MKTMYVCQIVTVFFVMAMLPLASNPVSSAGPDPPGPPPLSAHFGKYGELTSLPMFYINDDNSVPTEENLKPLVSYLNISGSAVKWNYHGILMYQAWLHYKKWTGPGTCGNWYEDLFGVNGTGGGLDTLNQVVGNLKDDLLDPGYLFNVVIAVCFEPGSQNANDSVDSLAANWTVKSYQNLTLVGFYWGWTEFASGYHTQISETAGHIHGYGLELFSIPYYKQWSPPGNDWHSLGVDYVMGQPNVAFEFPHDFTRFARIHENITDDSSCSSGACLDGVHFEIAYTCRDFNPPDLRCITREENAKAYLDAGFEYEWMKNTINGFYYSPGFLDAYAMGGGRVDIPTYDRPIYDRAHQFVRNFKTSILTTTGDAFVNEYFSDTNYGNDTRLLLGTNAAPNKMRFYTKFNIGQIKYGYVTKATLSVNLWRWVYGSSISDGQLYEVDDSSWEEMNITWNTQPPPPNWTLINSSLYFSAPGWYDFDVTDTVQDAALSPGIEITFMMKRQNENNEERECVFYSKEGSSLLSPRLEIEYVSFILVKMPSTNDSFVASAVGYWDMNYGNVPYFVLGTNTYPNALRPYLQYRLDAFPDNALLHSGSIVLYLTMFYYGSNITDGRLYFVSDDSWEEMNITWNNQPNQSSWSLRYDNLHFSSAYSSYGFSILNDLKVQHDGDNNASFMFKRQTEDATLHECGFWSREYAGNLGERAQLWVLMRAY